MNRTGLTPAAAAIAALLLIAAAHVEWRSLQHGYTIAVAVSDGPSSRHHITYPAWRAAALLALCAAALAALTLLLRAHRGAAPTAWLTVAAASLIRASDIQQYGTLGAPAAWTLPPFLLVAILTSLRTRH